MIWSSVVMRRVGADAVPAQAPRVIATTATTTSLAPLSTRTFGRYNIASRRMALR
jgi:hypothetical protein